MIQFTDRRDAGKRLARLLIQYRLDAYGPGVLVLALPRGGVPVGFEVAKTLYAPLDVFIVRKIGLPRQPELAIGAIASGGIVVTNHDVMRQLGVDQRTFDLVVADEKRELERRELLFHGGNRDSLSLKGRTCIIVDDGIATGASMMAATLAIRSQDPKHVIIAVPVASPQVYKQFAAHVDEVVCVQAPPDFTSVGLWYEDFDQTEDGEVRDLLQEARSSLNTWTHPPDDAPGAYQ